MEEKEVGVVTEQIDLFALHVTMATLLVRDAQERSLFRECRINKLNVCWACRAKRYILRSRYK